MKVKKILLSIALCIPFLIACFCFTGCIKLSGNDRSRVSYMQPVESNGEYIYDISGLAYHSLLLRLTLDGGVTVEEQPDPDYIQFDYPAVLSGDDGSPVHSIEWAEGYEGLYEILVERYETGKAKCLSFYAVEYDGENKTAYGLCNLYSSTVGFFAAGGQIASEQIIAGVYFKYNSQTREFEELERLEKCNLVAFNTQSLIYIKNRNYYAHTPGGEEDKFICKDEAYDTGLTHYSSAGAFFNSDLCIIVMNRVYSNDNRDYIKVVVSDYSGAVLYNEVVYKGL